MGSTAFCCLTAITASWFDTRARDALAHYDRAIERLKAGDWSGFGSELDAMRPLLEGLGASPPDDRR